jgi:hypothetical protein
MCVDREEYVDQEEHMERVRVQRQRQLRRDREGRTNMRPFDPRDEDVVRVKTGRSVGGRFFDVLQTTPRVSGAR